MKTTCTRNLKFALGIACALALSTTLAHAADALPSWNDGKVKQSVIDFVKHVSAKGGKDFVSPAERIAVFDSK